MDEAKKQRDSALADSEKARQDVAMLEETKQKMMGTIDVSTSAASCSMKR